MRHHVMHLPRDPGALGGGGEPGLLAPFQLQPLGAFSQALAPRGLAAAQQSRAPGEDDEGGTEPVREQQGEQVDVPERGEDGEQRPDQGAGQRDALRPARAVHGHRVQGEEDDHVHGQHGRRDDEVAQREQVDGDGSAHGVTGPPHCGQRHDAHGNDDDGVLHGRGPEQAEPGRAEVGHRRRSREQGRHAEQQEEPGGHGDIRPPSRPRHRDTAPRRRRHSGPRWHLSRRHGPSVGEPGRAASGMRCSTGPAART